MNGEFRNLNESCAIGLPFSGKVPSTDKKPQVEELCILFAFCIMQTLT